MSEIPSNNLSPFDASDQRPEMRDGAGHRADSTSPWGERVFRQLIAGRVFLVGVLIGLIVCCLLGWRESRRTPFRHFVRFHHWINPQTQFYPTVSQMIETAKSGLQPDQVLVIVGGDSVLFGSGQLAQDRWTIRLSELLGPKYKVVVLAYPGAAFADVGAVVGEALTKQGLQVVVLSHLYIGHLSAIQDLVHPHVFWQAWERNLLMDDPRRNHAIEQAIDSFNTPGISSADEAKKAPLREMPLAFGIDSRLHFNDLWTTVGYGKFFTVWNSLTSEKFYWPRRMFRDPEKPTPVEARNPPHKMIEGIELIRRMFERLCKQRPDGHWEEVSILPNDWLGLEDRANSLMPPAMRARTIAIFTYENPLYRSKLTADETEQYSVALHGTLRRMESAGYDTIAVGDTFTADEYFDLLHLTPSGGAKLADALAPEVVKLSKRLGYAP
ncbi:hypothetical protein BH10PLA1_BH10PLA1_20940 [soil metagenome]